MFNYYQKQIETGAGQSLKTQVSIPADKEGFMTAFLMNVGRGNDADLRIQTRLSPSLSWRTKRYLKNYESTTSIEFFSYIKMPAGCDVRVQAKAGVGSIEVSASYDYLLVPSFT